MRPLELDLTAFRSYDRATIDLRPLDLVVITGDTGAGKTSLLDAISFALFGKTPAPSTPTELLTLGREHGEVRLTFAARGEVWRMTRRYGARAPEPRHLLERLADDGGATVETIAGPEAVTARLTQVVGMGFKAFTSAVLLAQGQFAAFLSAAPKDRDAILRELFGVRSLDGAREAAQSLEAGARAVGALREADIARLPAHDATRRTAAARAAREAATRHAAASRLRPHAEHMAEEAAAAEALRARERSARSAADDLPDDAAAAALLARIEAARGEIAGAETLCAARRKELAGAAGAREALRARHGGGAADLAALRERAERAGRLVGGLPERAAALDGRREALRGVNTERESAAAALEAAVADDARREGRRRLAAAWREGRDARARAVAAHASAAAERAAAAGRDTAAAEALDEAVAQVERARMLDLAATVRAGLAAGDPCPVCGADFHGHAGEAGTLHQAEEALAAARRGREASASALAVAAERERAAAAELEAGARAAEDATAALAEAGITEAEADDDDADDRARADERAAAIAASRSALGALDAQLASEAARIEADEAQLARDRGEVEGVRTSLGPWAEHESPAAALGAAIEEAHAAERAADAAARADAAAAEARARAATALAELERGPVAALRSAAARAAARGRLDPPDDDAGAEELVAAARRLRATALEAAAVHARRAAEADARAAAIRDRLGEEGAALGITDAEQVGAAVRRMADALAAARASLADLDAVAASARALAAEVAEAGTRAQLHRQVALDLRANQFPRFLLARYRERLARAASEHLVELSDGMYRFAAAEPDPMAVIDRRRGERLRAASTLSGGERFLASLALALGLGDVAAESSGRLDCLFLDEGFSTLDADSLEQALVGVERLQGDGRLIAVITHLPGVAERLGASLHVTKDSAGVSSISGL
jgi:exonuclease SbcC